ncbi:hypothetical protein E3N88_38017 [Mikania micrantha]|uniref:Uncharacterized protein n=1 Tax=Mikania micrantha TaxID=192012 RepID=A0A5N6LT31_9ASTR|nr:hypothetical protein E3N88_38017 [Mikania micrantha]
MTAGAEVVCNEVARKVEIGESEVGDVVTVNCNVGGNDNGNGNVGGNERDDDGDSSHVFVSDNIKLSAGDSGDTWGVNVDKFLPKSASADEIGQFEKKESGLENEGMCVDPLVLESNGIVHGSTIVSDAEVKSVVYNVNLTNGSTVDSPVIVVANAIYQEANGHLDKIAGEQVADVKSSEEVEATEEISNVEAKTDDNGFGTTFIRESTFNTVESSQVSVSELEDAIKPSDVTDGVMVNDGLESISNLIGKEECRVTVDGSGITSEDLGFQVIDDGSESSESSIKELEGQATVDRSGKPSKDLGSQGTDDEPESCGSLIKELECKVSVNGFDSTGSLVDNQECPVSVDESESSAYRIEKVKSNTVVMKLDGMSEEHKELSVSTSEANGEVEPNHFCRVVKAENKKSEGTEIWSSTESEDIPNYEEGDALANGQGVKPDRILDMGETLISGTEADGISEKLLKVAESVEMEVNTEEMVHVKVEDGVQRVAIENVQDYLNLKDNTAESANEAEVSLVIETNIDTFIHETASSENGVSNCIGKPHKGLLPEASAENDETANTDENVVSDDEEKETEVKDAPVEYVHHIVSEDRSAGYMDCENGVKNVNSPDVEKEYEVNDVPVEDHSTLSFFDTTVKDGAVIKFGSIGCHETIPSIKNEAVEDMTGIHSDEFPNSSTNVEVDDAIDVENEEVEVLEYNFLIKIPRFEDETFRDQIRSAQVLVDEKTRLRDSIRVEVQGKRANMRVYNDEYNAAKVKEIAARRLVRAKRQEIESVQAVIDRWKNAMSVEDIDARIYGVEHMIQHETLLLKDEKQFIREIKQLKSLRDQLALNMGTPEEIRQAIDMKDHNEERLKILRKELDSLKVEVSKVEAVLQAIGEKYEEESRKQIELQAQFRAADHVRQQAYAHLNSLKKQSYDKNKNFRQFKDDVTKARTFASRKDKDALHSLCADQVETFMEQWNNNDEFRKEYVSRLNMIASRRQKALDVGPPVPDDAVPVLPSNVNEEIDRSSVSIPGEVKHVSVALPAEKGNYVSSTKNNMDNNSTSKSIENASGQKNQELQNKGVAKPTKLGSVDMANEEAELAVVAELAENACINEEIELAKKAEELRKEEIAAKLKEQRRLEEKAKAIEALERKKRNAEKAQLKAELWARKEAEQKEKEREKRLRKKEKKKTGGGDGEEAASSESSNEATTKEIETANKKKAQKPPAHFFSKQLKPKPVPPPLINKNKRRWQQWGKMALCFLAIFFVFLMANSGLLFDFKSARFNIPF